MITVDKKFIMNNRTARGAWTRAQLNIIGVDWPPAQGWIARVTGKQITESEAEEFKRLSGVKSKGKSSLEKNYLGVLSQIKMLEDSMIDNLLERLTKEVKRRQAGRACADREIAKVLDDEALNSSPLQINLDRYS